MVEDQTEHTNSKDLTKKEDDVVERSVLSPFSFGYVEKELRKKNFGILTTITPQGRPHSAGVVYGLAPVNQPFALYLVSRPVLKKVRNLKNNPNVSFVVPFPRLLFRMIPPACIQFQGKAEIISFSNQIALKAFRGSIVLRRCIQHSIGLGESIFIKVVPDNKIFCFGVGADIWDFLLPSKRENIRNLYVTVPQDRFQSKS